LAQLWTRSQLIFPSKTWFFEIYLNFHGRNHFKINISHIVNPNLTNFFLLNHAHQDLFNNTKGTFQFLSNFQLRFNFIFSEEIIQYSRTSTLQVQTPWNQADAPILLQSFPQRPRTRSEASWFGWISLVQTKQNKQTTLLHR